MRPSPLRMTYHALPFQAMGFCLFANAAILARYIQEKHGLRRLAILDWDVHRGNGTQHIFWEDPDVFFVSLQEHPLWPNSGLEWEKGEGSGEGATLNLAFGAGTEEADYLSRFEGEVIPAIENHRPDILIISAGFDAHFRDLIGNLKLTEAGFAQMTNWLVELSKDHCEGRILSLLEGGYNLSALESSVVAHLSSLGEN
jgi:acetoin utilization deacetylase AcuC-like enzyme